MNRRKYLVATTGIFSALAGCSTAKSVVRTGPANFADVQLKAPDEVAVGQEFDLTVTVRNNGGQTGDFTATLSVGGKVFSIDRGITIKNVPVGQTKSKAFPIQLGEVSDTRFAMTDYDVETTVSVTRASRKIGESITARGVRTVVQDVQVLPRFLGVDSFSNQKLFTTGIGKTFAFLRAEMKPVNDDQDLKYIPSPVLRTDSQTFEPSTVPTTPVGSSFGSSSQLRSGWIPFEIPESAVGRLRASWSRSDSAPDVVWSLGDPAYPEFEVQSVSIPDTVEFGTESTLSATVKNTGEGRGTFAGGFYTPVSYSDRWEPLSLVSKELDAGETTNVETTFSADKRRQHDVRFIPGEYQQTITVENPRLDLEESLNLPDGVNYTVDDIVSNVYSTYSYYDGESVKTVEASSGNQFAFAHVSVKNDQTSTGYAIGPGSFDAVVDGQHYSHTHPWVFSDIRLRDPVNGMYYYSAELASGEQTSGWLVFEVPTGTTAYDLTVAGSFTTDLTGYWSKPSP